MRRPDKGGGIALIGKTTPNETDVVARIDIPDLDGDNVRVTYPDPGYSWYPPKRRCCATRQARPRGRPAWEQSWWATVGKPEGALRELFALDEVTRGTLPDGTGG